MMRSGWARAIVLMMPMISAVATAPMWPDARALAQQPPPCHYPVEPLTLRQRTITKLRAPEFEKEVFVRVGDVHRKWAPVFVSVGRPDAWPEDGELSDGDFEAHRSLIPPGNSWQRDLRRPPDTPRHLLFNHGGTQYQLILSSIRWRFIGTDEITAQICRGPK